MHACIHVHFVTYEPCVSPAAGWMKVGSYLLFPLSQIHFLNLGLARGDATTIVPTYYVVWTFFGTLGGTSCFSFSLLWLFLNCLCLFLRGLMLLCCC